MHYSATLTDRELDLELYIARMQLERVDAETRERFVDAGTRREIHQLRADLAALADEARRRGLEAMETTR